MSKKGEDKMKIAICDDNKFDIVTIKNILLSNPLADSWEIDTYTSSQNLLNSIYKDVHYDITFLDVDIPYINGLDLGKKIKDKCPTTEIVFITNYPQYAIDAYDCEAFHYLLKPVDTKKAMLVIQRLIKRIQEQNKYYKIKIRTEYIRIPINDIYFIECCRKHIIYHLKDKRYETACGKFSDVCNDLKEYGFYQVHQGYIVNMDKIHHFDKYSVILDDNRDIMMSVRKRTEVLSAYAKYIEVRI